MAAADGSIRIDTKLDASKANKGISSLGESVKKLGGLIAAAFAITKIVSFAKASASAYATQIEAEQQLTTVLRNRYGATQDAIEAVKELTAAQQALGIVGDEVQMSGLKTLATYISNMEELTSITGAMNDLLAFQYGFNASPEGAKAIAKAMGQAVSTGSLSMLKRMGIAVDEQTASEFALAKESERVAMLQKLIEEKVGGVNAALANTPYGRIVQLKNAWGDFKELVGEAATTLVSSFVPALMKGINVLSGLATKLIEVAKAINIVFSGGSSAGNDQIEDSAKDAAKAEDALADSIEGVGDAIAGNLAGFDELNIMGGTATEDETPEEFGGFTDIGEGAEVDPALIDSVQKFKDILDSLGAVLKSRFEQAKEFASAVWDIVEAIRGGGNVGEALSNVIDLLTKNAMNLVGSIQNFFENHGAEIVEAAKNLILNIVQGISQNLPKVANSALSIVQALIDALQSTDFLNSLVLAVAEIIETIVGAIADNIPNIAKAAVSIIATIAKAIATNLQPIVKAAVEVITTIIKTIAENIPLIVEAAIEIILTIIETLTDPSLLGAIVDAAVEIVIALVEGIIDCLPNIIEAAINIILTLVNALTNADTITKLIDAAMRIISALITGLIQAIPQLIAAIPKLIAAIVDTLLNTNWLQVGIDIIKGIGQGLIDGVKNIGSAIGDACKGIWSTIKGWFGIRSPSKLMHDTVGNFIADGIGEGFEDEIGNVADDMEKALGENIDLDALANVGAISIPPIDLDELDGMTGDIEKALADNLDFGALIDIGDVDIPRFNLDEAIPYKVACEICKEKGDTFERMADSLEEIADDVREIRQNGGQVGTLEVKGANTPKTARETISAAERENRKAGRTIIPVGT